MGWVKLKWFLNHKFATFLGVLASIVTIWSFFSNNPKKEVIFKEGHVDWCQQTYGIKTPSKYIQNHSTRKCFYPLIYTVIKGNHLVCRFDSALDDILYGNIYTSNYQLNIGSFSNNRNLKNLTEIKIRVKPEERVVISCNSEISDDKGAVTIYESIEGGTALYCAITVLSKKEGISKPEVNVMNFEIDSQEIKASLWRKDVVGFDKFYTEKDIFKPINDAFDEKGIRCSRRA